MLLRLKRGIKSILPKETRELLVFIKHAARRIPTYKLYESYVKDKKGIEVGGPSTLFNTLLPIYRVVKNLDGVNFAGNTIWEGSIQSGYNYNYIGSKKGFQFISEATDLSLIKSNTYDFLLASNCLEHIANPLKAMKEWKRVLHDRAALILVLPNKESNFDHNRPFTSFEHLLEDYKNNTSEQDLTHLDEILALHDLSMDPAAGSLEEFRSRSLNNFNNRTLHHHVFDLSLIKQMLDYCGFEEVNTCTTRTDYFALGLKRDQCNFQLGSASVHV